jgi:hypothetical protein
MAVRNRIVVPLLATYKSACAADHVDPISDYIVFHGNAELAQCFDHYAGIFAIERAG